MADVVLFHHALGLTPGITAFARDLRGVGYTVHTPDLFEGRTFAAIEEGVGHAQEIGFDEVIERGTRAVAQKLAQTRDDARGALLFYSCVPVSEFGSSWPKGVAVHVHGLDADQYFVGECDIDAALAMVVEA
jgi:dienelactone hydrolase